MNQRETRLAWAAWAFVCVFWGTTYVAMRVCVATLPAILFAGTRQLASALVLIPILLLCRMELPRGREWGHLALSGFVMLGINNGVVVWSTMWLTAGECALMVAMTPFYMVLFDAMHGGDRVRSRAALGLLMGFCGTLVLVGPGLHDVGRNSGHIIAAVVLQGGCIAWAAGTVYARRLELKVKPLMASAWQIFFGGLSLTVVGLLLGEGAHFAFNTRSFEGFVYLMVFGSILGYSSFAYALQRLPMSTVSLYVYINPVFALAVGWAVLVEPFGMRHVIAVSLVLAGVLVMQKPQWRRLAPA